MKKHIAILSSILIFFGFNSLSSYGADVPRKSVPLSINAKEKWEQEPVSFAGLSLVAPIEQLPNCPYKEQKSMISSIPSVYIFDYSEWKQVSISDNTLIACVSKPRSEGIHGKPPSEFMWGRTSGPYELVSSRDIKPFFRSIDVVVFEKKIVELKVSIYSEDYQTAKAILIEKYGQPHNEEKGSIQTKGGASFPTETISWQGDAFLITFESMNYREYSDFLKKILEKGSLTIQNVVWKNALKKKKKKLIKNKADSL